MSDRPADAATQINVAAGLRRSSAPRECAGELWRKLAKHAATALNIFIGVMGEVLAREQIDIAVGLRGIFRGRIRGGAGRVGSAERSARLCLLGADDG